MITDIQSIGDIAQLLVSGTVDWLPYGFDTLRKMNAGERERLLEKIPNDRA